jgi:hypothetical protein
MERPTFKGEIMLQAIPEQPTAQTQIISTLSRLREERQEATPGASRIKTNGNIGRVLAGLINLFGLNAEFLEWSCSKI